MDGSPYADRWLLDPEVVFLNHGSFGATPKAVIEEQTRIQRRIESEPLQFFDHHYFDELQGRLFDEYRIEAPVIAWPAPPKRLIRISAQLYNHLGQYSYLAAALRELVT